MIFYGKMVIFYGKMVFPAINLHLWIQMGESWKLRMAFSASLHSFSTQAPIVANPEIKEDTKSSGQWAWERFRVTNARFWSNETKPGLPAKMENFWLMVDWWWFALWTGAGCGWFDGDTKKWLVPARASTSSGSGVRCSPNCRWLVATGWWFPLFP